MFRQGGPSACDMKQSANPALAWSALVSFHAHAFAGLETKNVCVSGTNARKVNRQCCLGVSLRTNWQRMFSPGMDTDVESKR
jgi:hypothetical protein